VKDKDVVGIATCQPVKCPTCGLPAAVILPDGSVQIASRHGGQTHYTVISIATLLKGISKSRLRAELERR